MPLPHNAGSPSAMQRLARHNEGCPAIDAIPAKKISAANLITSITALERRICRSRGNSIASRAYK